MIIYTLPVVDEDCRIAGKRGRVLVQSREIVLRSCALEDVAVGEAVDRIDGAPSGHRWWVLQDGRRFDEIEVTDKPNPRGKLRKEEFKVLLRVK